MNNKKITVCVVNYNSSDFIRCLLFSLKKLTHNPFQIIIRDNNSNLIDYLKLRLFTGLSGLDIVVYRVKTKNIGSLAHGEALNDLVKKINTQYGVIMDADAVFLVKDWDEILISKMSNNMPIYGTQADLGGGKPIDFPLMFALIFDNKIFQSLNIDFRPKDIKNKLDTGWELREKYLAHHFKGGLLYDFNTRNYKEGPFRKIVCNEYYLSNIPEGEIIASHFGRGSSPSSKRLIKFSLKFHLFNYLINIIKWKYDKMRWLSICKKIIKIKSNG